MEPFLGEVRMFGFSRVPRGWRRCDGSLLPISENDALFALLGTTYGGDGQTTFALPDLRGRVPLHMGQRPGSVYQLGQTGGAESVTLVPQQLPSHTHAYQATTQLASTSSPGPTVQLGALESGNMYATDGPASVALAADSTTVTGGSQPHDNLMPTLTVQFCIAVQGIFPSQN